MTKKNIIIKRGLVTISGILAVMVLVGLYTLKDKPLVSLETATTSSSVKPLFSDEFNGQILDQDKWVTCYNNYSKQYGGCSNYGNWEQEWYVPSQVKVSEGYLTLTAQKQKAIGFNQLGYTQDYSYISGMISSGSLNKTDKAKWGHTYGYYESRILSPYGQGVWPAFWLIPTDGSWPPEIDIMEVVGSKPNEIINTYFWKKADGSPAKDTQNYVHSDNLSNAWHTYGVDWQQDRIVWYFDGKPIRTVSSSTIPKKNMHIVLNLAIGGMLPGNPDNTTSDSLSMLVDYVRVYPSKEAADE